MKKLMMAAAIVCAAMAAQAKHYSIDWRLTIDGMKDPYGQYYANKSVTVSCEDLGLSSEIKLNDDGYYSGTAWMVVYTDMDKEYTFVLSAQVDDYTYSQTSIGTPNSTYVQGYVTFNYSASNWTQTSVPEPTSGLLMLMGGMLLGLRRKRV